MATTITYDEINKGWTSFHSYEPEWMDRLGNNFYSFKNGNIYLHDSNSTRTEFYGEAYGCNVTVSANTEPSTVKVFKALSLETNNPSWSAVLTTEQEAGVISIGQFVDKEDIKYAYIRRNPANLLDFNELSIIGVGNLVSYNGSNQFEFTSNIPNQVFANSSDTGQGDKLYFNNGSTLEVGVISDVTDNIIQTYLISNMASAGNPCFVVKHAGAESFGLRGYHSAIKLSNQSTAFLELYAVNSEVMKSYM